jgi:DNA repair protein RadD
MLLRPYQKTVVETCIAALNQHGNTLAVCPTGAGKTIMLAAITGRLLRNGARKAIVLQHRDELLGQNATKFRKVNQDLNISVFNAERKSWQGDAIFGSEPTLRRQENLERWPDEIDLVVVDEAHHVGAPGYTRILERAREANPKVKLLGVTATPNRGDKKALDHVFSNVGAQVGVHELIAMGYLVRPRSFVIDVGVSQALAKVKKTAADFDMQAVASIMDKEVVTDKVVEHWKDKAGDRRTVVFCSTIEHAEHVAEAFRAAGVTSAAVHSEIEDRARKQILDQYSRGKIQVLTNPMLLTEGWDDQPTSCVVLLRPCSYKSTMIQMIGRALRVVDPDLHPGVTKTDAVVLDFGRSLLTHGTIEQRPDLHPMRHCGACQQMVEHGHRCEECPPKLEEPEEGPPPLEKVELETFGMSEIDLLARSNFRWVDLFGDDHALMASGFEAWAGIFHDGSGLWHAIGGKKVGHVRKLLGRGERATVIALGDDWLNEHENDDAAFKSRRWLSMPATEAQLKWMPELAASDPMGFGVSRYQASCLLNFKFNRDHIKRLAAAA